MTLKNTRAALLSTALAALLLAGCSKPADDPHAAPRQTQAWENLDISSYDQAQLLAHLQRLATEANAESAAGNYIEFHHLEVALTPTLEALETKAAGNAAALATIATLKKHAINLHIAGHDGNVPMGVKLAAAITEQATRLAAELQLP